MIRIDKVSTRTGDEGHTSLGDGTRLAKDALRIEALGAVDEANASIGVLRLHVDAGSPDDVLLQRIQNGLFDIGGDLCMPGEMGEALRIDGRLLAALDAAIETMAASQKPLDSFVLPGGSAGAAQAHVVRTVVRRAERRVVSLAAVEPVNPEVTRALNRLSDYAFVLARRLNDDGRADVLWIR